MRRTRIAVTLVAALGLSACGTVKSWFDNDDSSPAPVSSANEEAATVGRVVYSSDELLDVRMDNGDLRTVIQKAPDTVRLGDRVRLADGRAYRY